VQKIQALQIREAFHAGVGTEEIQAGCEKARLTLPERVLGLIMRFGQSKNPVAVQVLVMCRERNCFQTGTAE
jgi:hypothetical protein